MQEPIFPDVRIMVVWVDLVAEHPRAVLAAVGGRYSPPGRLDAPTEPTTRTRLRRVASSYHLDAGHPGLLHDPPKHRRRCREMVGATRLSVAA